MPLRILPLILLALLPAVRAGEPDVVAKAVPQFRPRADTISLVPPKAGMLVQPVPFVPFKREWKSETPKVTILFLARTRPVRIEATFDYEGKVSAEKWNDSLKTLFAAFDRDSDGYLNRHEAERIFSLAEMKQLLTTGYGYRTAQAGPLPTIEAVDRDGDGRASFDEFAAYYDPQATNMFNLSAYPNYAQPDTITMELFARLDANGDGRITTEEFRQAETLFPLLDSDEDECLTMQEFLANPVKKVAAVPLTTEPKAEPGAMMGTRPAKPQPAPPSDTLVFRGPLPGTVVQQIIKKYDKNDDFELSREELGYTEADFNKLDSNRNGKISATELDAWREKPADLKVNFSIATKPTDGKTTITAGKGCSGGIDLPKPGTNLILHVGTQTLDLGTSSTSYGNANMWAGFFQGDKKEITEAEVNSPQYQYLRVMFDCVDFNGDGKITKAEVDRYSDLQQAIAALNQSLFSTTRVPTLFGLIDANNDGRISVRELRTASGRIAPLEPSDTTAITKAVLQPSAVVRVGRGQTAASDPALYGGNQFGVPRPAAAESGPAWYRKMDRNGDGEISRAEFLGSKADFDAVDADSDGYISLNEAAAFDAKSRKK